MHRTLLAIVILGRLATAPFARADEPVAAAPALSAAAARQAQAAAVSAPAPRRPMSRGTLWAGAGMLGVSAPIALSAAIGDCLAPAEICRDRRHAVYVGAGVLAAEGAALLTIAHLQRLGPEPDPLARRMRPGLKWTGVGLLTGSVLMWSASESRNCFGTRSCNERKDVGRALSAATAAAGGVVLATGFATRRAWPSVVVTRERAFVRQRFTF